MTPPRMLRSGDRQLRPVDEVPAALGVRSGERREHAERDLAGQEPAAGSGLRRRARLAARRRHRSPQPDSQSEKREGAGNAGAPMHDFNFTFNCSSLALCALSPTASWSTA